MDKNTLQSILDLAVYAPSGHNGQPWKFKYNNDLLYIYNQPESDNSIYNYKQRGSYFAHGALIANIEIIAPSFGYLPTVSYFPVKENEDLVATIAFTATPLKKHELLPYIPKRITNRKPYKKRPLSNTERTVLLALNSSSDLPKLHMTEDPSEIANISSIFTLNEELLFESRSVHSAIFTHINWSLEDEERLRSGLYIKTLELPPPAEFMFSRFRSWNFTHNAGKIGFGKLIAKSNAAVYTSTSAIGAIAIPTNNAVDFVHAGRSMQYIWLEAEKLGLSIHPVAAVAYMAQHNQLDQIGDISPRKQAQIMEGYDKIKNILGIHDGELGFAFRLGEGPRPTAHALRKQPVIN